ncbi:hypothetical protein HDV05_005342 [Chytridiales sp. JEL 0842]|nr:hypothetical protein HDV05_005342 [Chytridiales sp. JEL 0842]
MLSDKENERASTAPCVLFSSWQCFDDSYDQAEDFNSSLPGLHEIYLKESTHPTDSGIFCKMDVYDVMHVLKDANFSYYEVEYPGLHWFLEGSATVTPDLVLEASSSSVNELGEEVFAAHGEAEEWFAHDDRDETTRDTETRNHSYKRRGLPPVTPCASIRQDIMGHLFDDLWSEIIPGFQPILDSMQSGNQPTEQTELVKLSLNADEDLEEAEILPLDADHLLLSAMTIRPVPLQKRESSARVRTSISKSHDIRALLNFIPPRLGAPRVSTHYFRSAYIRTKQRAYATTSDQSESCKIAECNAFESSGKELETQLAAALPSTPMNDMVYGTREMSRPSTSVGVASKRLPPIKFSTATYEHIESPAPALISKPGARHVLFDTPDTVDFVKLNRSTSPRPFSARRNPSGGLRGRPHALSARPQVEEQKKTTIPKPKFPRSIPSASPKHKEEEMIIRETKKGYAEFEPNPQHVIEISIFGGKMRGADDWKKLKLFKAPDLRMRFTTVLRDVVKIKQTTGLYGLPVNPNPRPELLSLYNRILHTTERLPKDSVFRKSVEATTRFRLEVVEKETSIPKLEEAIGGGQVEELIIQAKEEYNLVLKMSEWEPWNALEEPAPAGQWVSPKV